MGTIVPTTTNDEDSLSLSEYTDNEKSAPTELLAEFLTSIMKKDYVNALKYCKLSKLWWRDVELLTDEFLISSRLWTDQQDSKGFLSSTRREG